MARSSVCRHLSIRGPLFLGERGPMCDDCVQPIKCAHPASQRKHAARADGAEATTCGWCGAVL